MRYLAPIAVILLSACEPMEPSGNPFQPVTVQAESTPAVEAAVDSRFADFAEPEVISMSELRAKGSVGADTNAAASSSDGAASPADAAATTETVDAAAPPAAPVAAAAAAPKATPVLATNAPLGWAVRLVKTVPEAQPPRAILGLPDGREVVVTPGSMVPDAGLVVLSVGPNAVQVARVKAVGDHATVDAFSLTPQY